MKLEIYLRCKSDRSLCEISLKQLKWLREHATDYNLTEIYDVAVYIDECLELAQTAEDLEDILQRYGLN